MRYTTLLMIGLLFFFSCEDEYLDVSSDPASFSNYADGNFRGEAGDPPNTERYNEIVENPFIKTADEAVSTFSIDADGGSYGNTRRFLMRQDMLPPTDAIRVEEFINYFQMDYEDPRSDVPVAVNGEVSDCPWKDGHKLVRIGLKGKSMPKAEYPASNLVFLIDISGSMSSNDKLSLLKKGFKIFVDELRDKDVISIVTYAGSAGIVLEPTSGDQKDKIKRAIDNLESGGSTAGAAGIEKAYQFLEDNFVEGGNNRVILGTDGDFNVGISSQEELIKLIEEKRESGIFLTVLGVGTGNYNEAAMEQIANHGNGNYEYIDNVEQARKVFVYEYERFFTMVKDVKVQVEFNANIVKEYRLIGYENRLLEKEDFEDDTKDAGEIGAGQTITALYEIVPNQDITSRSFPTFTIDFRYKFPDGNESSPLSLDIFDEGTPYEKASENMRFAAAVASFGMLLRDSEYKGDTSFDKVLEWVDAARTYDPNGFRNELRSLIQKAKGLK